MQALTALSALSCLTPPRSSGPVSGSAGPFAPASVVNDDATGDIAWETPEEGDLSDDVYATATLNDGASSQLLTATDFSLDIPGGATVKGIEVLIERSSIPNDPESTGGWIEDLTIRLRKASGLVGANRADDEPDWPDTDILITYGGPTDLWDTTWTPAEINASTFGVSLQIMGFTDTEIAQVDQIRIKVYYEV